MNLEKSEIRKVLANLYEQACLDESCDMREVVDVYENLTTTFLSHPTMLAWTKVKLDQKRFGKAPYFELIRSFRNDVFSLYSKKAISEIHRLCGESPKSAFDFWLEVYTDALLTFEWEAIVPLFRENFPFGKSHAKRIHAYARLNRLVMDHRWADATPFFIEFAEDKHLPNWKRVYFSAYVSEIMLYHFGYADQAQLWQRKTVGLDPHHFLAERLQGEIELSSKNLVAARNHLLNAISMDSHHVDSYLFMGDTFLDEQAYETAKQWYLDGIGIHFLNSSSYKNLFKLFGNAKWIDGNQEELASYIAKMVQIETRLATTVDLYNGYRDLAYAHHLHDDIVGAKKYYKKAIKLAPDLTSAKIDLGYILSYKEMLDEAETYFRDALDHMGDYPFDGYWAFGWLSEQKGDFVAARQYYLKCLGLRQYGEDRIYNVMGLLYFKQEMYAEAIEEFRKAIEAYPGHSVYFDNLKDAAQKSGLHGNMGIYHDLLVHHFPQNHLYANNAGVFYFEQKDFNKAIELYSKAIELSPNDILYFKNRALAYQKTEQYADSEADLLQALSLAKQPAYLQTLNLSEAEFSEAMEYGRDADLLNSIGLVKYFQEKYQEAILFYDQAIRLDSSNMVFIENRAIAKERLERYREAINDYTKVLKVSEDPYLYNAVGRLEYWLKNYQEAIEFYSKALNLAPKVQVYWENRALALQDSGKFEEAEHDYMEAMKLGPNINCLNALAIIQTRKGEYAKAIELYSEAIELDDRQALIFENRSVTYEKMGLYDLAEQDMAKALELAPNAYRYNFLGLILFRKNKPDLALPYYTHAIHLDPKESIFLENRGLAHLNLNNLDLAKKDFEDAVLLSASTNALNYLGIIHSRQENYKIAVDYYSKAIGLDHRQAILWENRALSWESLGEYENAEDDTLRAIDIEPNSTRYNFLGLIRYRRFNYPGAIDCYSKAIEIDSNDPIIWENRALAYEDNGNYKEAIEDYLQCLSFSEDAYFYNKLGEIHKTLGNMPEAKEYFRRAVELRPDDNSYRQNMDDCI